MNIKQLSKSIRQSYRKTKSWNATGEIHRITGAMAFRIAKHNYEPASEEIRERLGLDVKTCPRCGHRHFNRKQIPKPDYIVKWHHLPKEERHKVIREYLNWKENQ